MKFMFFTLGGRLFWEDVYNFQNWIIQKNVRTLNYRLLDPHSIRRASGTFEQCRDALIKYIEAYEMTAPYDDSIVLIPGFGQSKKALRELADELKTLPANIIIFNHASLRQSLIYHANILAQFLKNIKTKNKTSFITVGSGGLVLRKMIGNSNNYRSYNIHRVLELNPLNSGSDLAELLEKNKYAFKLAGPMIRDITPQKTTVLAKLPQEIEHGLLFCSQPWKALIRKILSRYDSFPIASRPSEESFAKVVYKISEPFEPPLKDKMIVGLCRRYIENGYFTENDKNAGRPKNSTLKS